MFSNMQRHFKKWETALNFFQNNYCIYFTSEHITFSVLNDPYLSIKLSIFQLFIEAKFMLVKPTAGRNGVLNFH